MNTDEDVEKNLARMAALIGAAYDNIVSAMHNIVSAMHIAIDVEDQDLDQLMRARAILRNFINNA